MGMDPRINGLIKLTYQDFDSTEQFEKLFGIEEDCGVKFLNHPDMCLYVGTDEMLNMGDYSIYLHTVLLKDYNSTSAEKIIVTLFKLIDATKELIQKYPGLQAEALVNVNYW